MQGDKLYTPSCMGRLSMARSSVFLSAAARCSAWIYQFIQPVPYRRGMSVSNPVVTNSACCNKQLCAGSFVFLPAYLQKLYSRSHLIRRGTNASDTER